MAFTQAILANPQTLCLCFGANTALLGMKNLKSVMTDSTVGMWHPTSVHRLQILNLLSQALQSHHVLWLLPALELPTYQLSGHLLAFESVRWQPASKWAKSQSTALHCRGTVRSPHLVIDRHTLAWIIFLKIFVSTEARKRYVSIRVSTKTSCCGRPRRYQYAKSVP